jgi:sec-independent protein translocase protein TatA
MTPLFVLAALGMTEILLIVLGIVLLFGGRKIPELMKGIGQGMREFKKASRGEDDTPEKKE